jgi:hypothetical protein
MSRQDIAKILFQFHQEIWDDPEELEKDWKDLPDDRNFSCMYSVCKREYLRMADGVRKKILNEQKTNSLN